MLQALPDVEALERSVRWGATVQANDQEARKCSAQSYWTNAGPVEPRTRTDKCTAGPGSSGMVLALLLLLVPARCACGYCFFLFAGELMRFV